MPNHKGPSLKTVMFAAAVVAAIVIGFALIINKYNINIG